MLFLFGRDGCMLFLCCEDGMLNVWDLCNVKVFLKWFEDLLTCYSEITVGWSLNDVYFFIGVDVECDLCGGNM